MLKTEAKEGGQLSQGPRRRLVLVLMFVAVLQGMAEPRPERGTAYDQPARYFTEAELEVVKELNAVRVDPRGYAERVIKPLTGLYRGKLLEYPGEVPIMTREGPAAADQCYQFLRAAAPVPELQESDPLSRAAADHVRYQGPRGGVGHAGHAGQSPADRTHKYAPEIRIIGENISYGTAQARRIVTQLLIDDGVPSRGHRENIMGPDYDIVGVSIGPHASYGHMCVIVFARSR